MRNKTTAAILALVFGMFGAHWYYLGRKIKAILSTVFFFTGIPLIFSFFKALSLLSMSQKKFDKKYNGGICSDLNMNIIALNNSLNALNPTACEKAEEIELNQSINTNNQSDEIVIDNIEDLPNF